MQKQVYRQIRLVHVYMWFDTNETTRFIVTESECRFGIEDLTEVKGHRRVVVCFTVSNEVDLMLPLLLLQPVFGAAMVTHTAAAQNEDDRPHQPKPCKSEEDE